MNTLATVSTATAENQGQFTVEVPVPGMYIVFASTSFGVGGTHSTAVPCGLTATCRTHKPTPLYATLGGTVTDADI